MQRQGGWTSPAVLLNTYTHFLPSELSGFADVLSAGPDGTRRDQRKERPKKVARAGAKPLAPARTSVVAQGGIEPPTRGFSVARAR